MIKSKLLERSFNWAHSHFLCSFLLQCNVEANMSFWFYLQLKLFLQFWFFTPGHSFQCCSQANWATTTGFTFSVFFLILRYFMKQLTIRLFYRYNLYIFPAWALRQSPVSFKWETWRSRSRFLVNDLLHALQVKSGGTRGWHRPRTKCSVLCQTHFYLFCPLQCVLAWFERILINC